MSFVHSCLLLTSDTCAECWAPVLYRGLSCLPGIGRFLGSAMATGENADYPTMRGSAARVPLVSIVVQGTERVDHVPIRGSAARVPPARVVTATCTKEVRNRKVIGKGKGSRGTPGGPVSITNAPWNTNAPWHPDKGSRLEHHAYKGGISR